MVVRNAPPLRYFTIPGNGADDFDSELHGEEITVDDDRFGSGDVIEVGWRPGFYTFSTGSGGSSFDFHVPEASSAELPSQQVLRAIHEFLKVAYDG